MKVTLGENISFLLPSFLSISIPLFSHQDTVIFPSQKNTNSNFFQKKEKLFFKGLNKWVRTNLAME